MKELMKFVFTARARRGGRRGACRYVRRLPTAPTWSFPRLAPATQKLQRKSFIAGEREWNEKLCRSLSGIIPIAEFLEILFVYSRRIFPIKVISRRVTAAWGVKSFSWKEMKVANEGTPAGFCFDVVERAELTSRIIRELFTIK